MARSRALYVETLIRADMDQLWRLTQEPGQHQRWDLRFTRIEPCQDGPGQFRYVVRLLPGLQVSGMGVCAGERIRPDGTCTSALRFGSGQRLSLIRSGSGYWRYVPEAAGIRFLTGYDYRPGWGRLGWPADRVFRPLLGWATAWSFDRLRLWLENGVPPERSLRLAVLDAWLRIGLLMCAWNVLPVSAAVLAMGAIVGAPPLHGVPSARRCLRHPPDRPSGTAPRALAALPPPALAAAADRLVKELHRRPGGAAITTPTGRRSSWVRAQEGGEQP